MPSPRSVYLDTEPDPISAIYHPPQPGVEPASAVLICPPWGWDEVASYRSRRAWAERLAAAGHPTLRFALPATGNSAGSPRDPERLRAWRSALSGAAAWLREASGAQRLAALGLGLGGLLARAALAEGAPIDELVLWGAPASGWAFARETRAFSRLQAWNGAVAAERPEAALPEGWIEAGGFVLSAETLAGLRELGPEIEPGPRLRRALLLERDGVAVDEGLRDGLATAGIEVEVAPGPGWADLVSHAEHTKLSARTADLVAEWLAQPLDRGEPAAAAGPAELGEMEIEVEGHGVRERVLEVELPFGRATGVIAEPAGTPGSDLCAICLNAGAVRSIGPNRIWVETARRWAAAGMPTLRIDLEGIGEADGEAPADVTEFYLPKFERELGAVLDQLEQRGLGRRFVLAGLCAGGYWAFQRALGDPRVETVLLLNSGALAWDPGLVAQREARKVGRASQGHWWGRLLRGEVGFSKLRSLARSLLVAGGRSLRSLPGRRRGSLKASVYADLDRLSEAGTALHMAFSDEEPLAAELRAYGVFDELGRWPELTVTRLPGADHTLRPVAAQAAAREFLDTELARLRSLSLDGARRGSGC
jgi:dienelactone hydrolase